MERVVSMGAGAAELPSEVNIWYAPITSESCTLEGDVSKGDKCDCGEYGTLRHILSACPLGLKDRYTWRHNQVLRVIVDAMETKLLRRFSDQKK